MILKRVITLNLRFVSIILDIKYKFFSLIYMSAM